MERNQALVVLAVALLMISAGLTWKFGAYGLIGAGAILVAAVALLPAPRRPKSSGKWGDRK